MVNMFVVAIDITDLLTVELAKKLLTRVLEHNVFEIKQTAIESKLSLFTDLNFGLSDKDTIVGLSFNNWVHKSGIEHDSVDYYKILYPESKVYDLIDDFDKIATLLGVEKLLFLDSVINQINRELES